MNTTRTEAVITGLVSGRKYYLRITVTGAVGESVPSNISSTVAR